MPSSPAAAATAATATAAAANPSVVSSRQFFLIYTVFRSIETPCILVIALAIADLF